MPIPVTEETLAELHQIAHEIGLKVNWFQEGSWPHYDITESKREAAIKAGAIPMTTQEMAKMRLAEKRKRRGLDEMENR